MLVDNEIDIRTARYFTLEAAEKRAPRHARSARKPR